MKTIRFITPISLLILISSTVFAEIPNLLSFQGLLTDSIGNSITDNIHAVKFKIYADSNSEVVYWESNGFVPIQTSNGKFKHVLGATNLLPDSLSKLNNLWLGITVGLAEELRPRSYLLKISPLQEPIKASKPETAKERFDLPEDDIYGKIDKPTTFPKSPKPRRYRKRPQSQDTSTIGISVKPGIDILGSQKVSGLGLSTSGDVKTGLSLSIILYKINPAGTLRYGVGGELQIPRRLEAFSGKFNFNSLIAELMIHPSRHSENAQLYLIGRLGYNFFNGDKEYKGTGVFASKLEGGLHFGIGVGFIIDRNFLFEILYALNNGEGIWLDENFSIKYSRARIAIGFNFMD